ncbi:uncharacterized protein LOC105423586 [Pogonomyrmex barbatus]|uniref:Uncharacterized protein LOC105423586 n=1 Tax=Pogonomyrmex barbatus TaxID=144034 RepID=A0A6I9VX97_9HYME|nr:uncharacterized protein LOC105423586 [Pogonomyrmex barbatus]
MTHITEPVRKSALDVVQYNLRAIGYKSYVTRVVYFGEYRGTHEVLRKRMEDIIQDLCMDYNNIPITGLFLVYPTCYVHVLESIDVQDALRNLKDKARYLPENAVLESLLNVNLPVLKTVEEYLRLYSDVSPSDFWDGKNYTYIQ